MAITKLFFVHGTIFYILISKFLVAGITHHSILQTKLMYQIIDTHLDDCYVIKARKQASGIFINTKIKVPVIEINYDVADHTKISKQFTNTSRGSLMIKHTRQCIVYFISLAGFKTNGNALDSLLETFQIKALQLEATYSYLLISEFENYDIFRSFIMSPQLKSYQYRISVKPFVDSNGSCTGFKFNRFCYFCLNGNPDIAQENRIYRAVHEIAGVNAIFPDMTKKFNGKTMRVIAPPAPPLVLILPSKTEAGKYEVHGQHGIILKSIARYFNFSYTLKPSPLTGIRLDNGTWNGIMGEILYDQADIGLSVATSYDRYKIVDVTTNVFYAFLVLVSTKPQPVFEWQAVFYPFEKRSWLGFIVSTALAFFLSKWIHNTSIKFDISLAMQGKTNTEVIRKLKAQFMTNYKTFYITVGNLLEQGPPFDFNTTPSRMFITFWMLFAMIITTAYRSKLFTFLTFPTVEVPPSTFRELIGSSYKWGMKHLGGIAFVFITKSPLTYVRNIGERMQVYNDKYSCLDRTFRDRFTCIIYKAYIDYMMEIRYWKLRRNFHVSDFVSPPVGSAWALPKYAPWLPVFNKASYPIFEMGLADKYMNDYQVSTAKVLRANAQVSNSTQDVFDLNLNFKSDGAGPKPLVMANLYAAFFILIVGIVASLILLACEVARHHNHSTKLSDRQCKIKLPFYNTRMQKKKELGNANGVLEQEKKPKDAKFSRIATRRTTNYHYYHQYSFRNRNANNDLKNGM